MSSRLGSHSGKLVASVIAVALLGLVLPAFSCAAPPKEEPAKPPVTEPVAPAEKPAEKPAVVSGPPLISHTLEGRDNCLSCHQVGAAGVGQPGGVGLTAAHQGRTIEMCRGCHQAAQ